MSFLLGLLGVGANPIADISARVNARVNAWASVNNHIDSNAVVGVQEGAIQQGAFSGAVVGIQEGAIKPGAFSVRIANAGLLVVVILLVFQGADPSGNLRYLLSLCFGAIFAFAFGIGVVGTIYKATYVPSDVPPETTIIAPTRLVLVGNPGVGKSTILNGLVKEKKFDSGISFTGTLTTKAQSTTDSNRNTFIDTPGLSDYSTRGEAAKEITKAIKDNCAHGNMKLIFVVKLDAGRVRATDTVTIQLVLDAFPQDTAYGIVVNQVSPQVLKKLFSNTGERSSLQKLGVCLNQGRDNTTTYIHFIPLDPKLCDCENILPAHSPELIEFINSVPTCDALNEDDINQVRSTENMREIEETEAENNRQMKLIIENEDLMNERIKEMEEKHKMQQEMLREKLRAEEAVDKCVGPIFSHAEAPAKINRWLARNPGW
eukprot:CAMPEP_0183715010 /NCGR_PEP_ID=MMETSP0737-20130205/9390_1 /TAXON_ID=385413 /ORGANISM="Thalassiosira miniscula, Strain CCMP1093" /LENGTH=430 /DNA_ID=CAMNT_0025944061 /DNA_START=77 /DNA_END=1366 /DNA_ORIENTATION=+